MDHQNIADEISDDSLSKWPPSGQQKMSLRQGLYTSFNKDIFQEKSDKEQEIWSSLEYPPSPKDAFQETCDFYDEQIYSRRKGYLRAHHTVNGGLYNGGSRFMASNGVTKAYRAKPRHLDFYKSDSKLTQHYADSSGDEMEYLPNPMMGRSKSLHDLERSRTPSKHDSKKQQQEQPAEQIGLSEHDLNRARSVLGLPLSDPNTNVFPNNGYNLPDADHDVDGAEAGVVLPHDQEKHELDLGYDSQPASIRNSLIVSCQDSNINERLGW